MSRIQKSIDIGLPKKTFLAEAKRESANSSGFLNSGGGYERNPSASPVTLITQEMVKSRISGSGMSTTKSQKLMTDCGPIVKNAPSENPQQSDMRKNTPKRYLHFVHDSPLGTSMSMIKPHDYSLDTSPSYESPSVEFLGKGNVKTSRIKFASESPSRLEKKLPLETLDFNIQSIPTQRETPGLHRVQSVPANLKLQPSEGKENARTWERSYSNESDASSLDSGIGMEKDRENDFQFHAPQGRPLKKRRESSELCSEEPFSPATLCHLEQMQSGFSDIHFLDQEGSDSTPHGLSPHKSEDGFMDLEKFEDTVEGVAVMGPMKALLTLPVNTQAICISSNSSTNSAPSSLNETPVSRRHGRLNRSHSIDVESLYASKRTKREEEETEESKESKRPRAENTVINRKRLRRSHSLPDAENIMHAVSKLAEIPELIGDTTKFHRLPVVPGRHQDLKTIEPSTLLQLMNHEFEDIEQFHIIDCRFPYEYRGGHIMGARNLFTPDMVRKEFFDNLKELEDKNKRMVLVFHCEFSSERGPARFRDLRRMDRERNTHRYPHLHYPEIYVLEGGYKAFFEQYKEFCDPQKYLPMKHKEHREDLRLFKSSRHFKTKARTFPGDTPTTTTISSCSTPDVPK